MTPLLGGRPIGHQLGPELEQQHGVVTGEARRTGWQHGQRTAHVLDLPRLIQILARHY